MNQSIHINDIRHVDFIHNKHWFVYLIPFLRHQGQKKKRNKLKKTMNGNFRDFREYVKLCLLLSKKLFPEIFKNINKLKQKPKSLA